jgi:hypothetical protein
MADALAAPADGAAGPAAAPSPLPPAETAAVLELALAWLYGHGFAMVPPSRDPTAMAHIPFALLPRRVRSAGGGRALPICVSPSPTRSGRTAPGVGPQPLG